MYRPSLIPTSHTMALLAIFATFVPPSSACCCCKSMVEPKSRACCTEGSARRTCCQDKSRSTGIQCKGQQRCSCSTISGRQGNSPCRCAMKELVNREWSLAPTHDAFQVGRHLEDCWSGVLYVPSTVASYAIERSLKPDVILSHERLSAQVLLGAWRN
jgi:hypothetical protein